MFASSKTRMDAIKTRQKNTLRMVPYSVSNL